MLKEIGITKVGDRVRIFVAVKSLRDRAFGNARKRNRVGTGIVGICTGFIELNYISGYFGIPRPVDE